MLHILPFHSIFLISNPLVAHFCLPFLVGFLLGRIFMKKWIAMRDITTGFWAGDHHSWWFYHPVCGLVAIFYFSINIGFLSSSQLTFTHIFQRGGLKPPTSHVDYPFIFILDHQRIFFFVPGALPTWSTRWRPSPFGVCWWTPRATRRSPRSDACRGSWG